jgi:hypothetical protein
MESSLSLPKPFAVPALRHVLQYEASAMISGHPLVYNDGIALENLAIDDETKYEIRYK